VPDGYLYTSRSEDCGGRRRVSEAPSEPDRRRGAPEPGPKDAEMTQGLTKDIGFGNEYGIRLGRSH